MSSEKRGLLFIICGPSGSGKTTLAENILKEKSLKNKIEKSVSFTTRPKRTAERNKKDYFFISEERFKQELREKKILEWTKYLGYYYGTPGDFLDEKLSRGRNTLLCVDLKGVSRLKRLYPKESVTVFIMPPSLRVLRERIGKRCRKIGKEEIHKRLKLARGEILSASKFDYQLVNKDLAKSVKQLKNIILRKIGN